MLDIAEASGLGLVGPAQDFPFEVGILAAFTRMIDDAVLAKAMRPAADTATRDAIFEVVMSRFDTMQPYKPGLKLDLRDLGFDTDVARRLFASQAWMLNASGVPLDGARRRGAGVRADLGLHLGVPHLARRRRCRSRADHGGARPTPAARRAELVHLRRPVQRAVADAFALRRALCGCRRRRCGDGVRQRSTAGRRR